MSTIDYWYIEYALKEGPEEGWRRYGGWYESQEEAEEAMMEERCLQQDCVFRVAFTGHLGAA